MGVSCASMACVCNFRLKRIGVHKRYSGERSTAVPFGVLEHRRDIVWIELTYLVIYSAGFVYVLGLLGIWIASNIVGESSDLQCMRADANLLWTLIERDKSLGA